LGGPRSDPRFVSPMGTMSSTLTFGHNGSDCCVAWADSTRRLAVAYLTNRLTGRKEAVEHLAEVADDILFACPVN
jgi:CubicO group peptidase (beta-lactamase class C family)